MKLPRGVSSDRVIRMLLRLDYEVVHQKGSHVKMRSDRLPTHTVIVPRHDSIKIGTLHSLLTDVANARSMMLDALIEML